MTTPSTIADLQAQIAATIQDALTRDTAKWHRLRALALEADGRTGYQDLLGRAYLHAKWMLVVSGVHGYAMAVDLVTPRLIVAIGTAGAPHTLLPQVHEIAGLRPDLLDIDTLLKRYEAAAANIPALNKGFTPYTDAARDTLAATTSAPPFHRYTGAPL